MTATARQDGPVRKRGTIVFELGLIGWLIASSSPEPSPTPRTAARSASPYSPDCCRSSASVHVVAGRPALPPPAPIGMRSSAMPEMQCGAEHLPATNATFECWQCKLVSEAAAGARRHR